MKTVRRILIHHNSGKKFLVKNTAEDFHTSFGVISSLSLKSVGEVKSSKGEAFSLIEPTFSDLWEQLQRGPQIIPRKDIGLILAKTGINNSSTVVDAGGGSGSLCLSLANVCREVTVYEINPEHYDLVAKNGEQLRIKNLQLKQASIYDGISEQNLDLITLDLPEPWRVIEHAERSLKAGGHQVVYLPNLNQVKMFIDSAQASRIKVMEIIELLERKWKIAGKIMRPEFEMLGHSGFLVFCRRL